MLRGRIPSLSIFQSGLKFSSFPLCQPGMTLGQTGGIYQERKKRKGEFKKVTSEKKKSEPTNLCPS